MYWQKEVYRDSVGMTFNQTYELDLPKQGQLGSIGLYVRSAANAGALTSLLARLLIDYISKIEVIGDGAEVIKSFDGRQALACAYYDDGVLPLGKWGSYSGVTHRQFIPIHFGRKFWDEVYGLDLSRFNQVTLKITNTATSTQFTTNVSLTVVLYWMRDGGGFGAGYFREEEHKLWAPTSSATEYTILPIALPIRRILIRARAAVTNSPVNQFSNTVTNQVNDVDFNMRSGRTRIYKGGIEELGWAITSENGRHHETSGEVWTAADDQFDTHLSYVTQIVPAAAAIDDPAGTYPGSVIRADTQLGSQSVWDIATTSPVEYLARGYGIMENVPLFEARKPDMSDIMVPAEVQDVTVDILAASATYTGNTRNAETGLILSRLVA